MNTARTRTSAGKTVSTPHYIVCCPSCGEPMGVRVRSVSGSRAALDISFACGTERGCGVQGAETIAVRLARS